jgi:hypothetical protein
MQQQSFFAITITLAVALLLGAGAVWANNQDQYIAGGSVRVDKPVAGDLIAAGGNVDVEAAVDGDVVMAGGNLRVSAAVGQSLHAVGGRLLLEGAVGRNLRVAAGQVDVSAKASVGRNLTVGGGQVSVRGPVKGSVMVGGGSVTIDSVVDGDVSSTAGRLTLGPNARIGGALRYRSKEDLTRDPAAQVAGVVERLPVPGRSESGRSASGPRSGWDDNHHERMERWGGGIGWFWAIGLMALAAVLVSAWPAATQRMATTWRQRWGGSVLWGFVVVVCLPVAAVLMMVTIIGMPIALLTVLLFFALLLLGYAASGIALGEWALVRWRSPNAQQTGWRMASAALALLALALLSALPWVGWWVAVLAMLAGVGAIVQQTRWFKPSVPE